MKRQRQDKTLELTVMQHPRRVAVPVLVRDGKPCHLGQIPGGYGTTPYNVNPFSTYSVPSGNAYSVSSPSMTAYTTGSCLGGSGSASGASSTGNTAACLGINTLSPVSNMHSSLQHQQQQASGYPLHHHHYHHQSQSIRAW